MGTMKNMQTHKQLTDHMDVSIRCKHLVTIQNDEWQQPMNIWKTKCTSERLIYVNWSVTVKLFKTQTYFDVHNTDCAWLP